MHLRAPEGFVDIDVAEACDRALVKQGRLDWSPAASETFTQASRREAALERFAAEPPLQIVLDLFRLEQVPGTEAPDVAIRDILSVV